MEKEDEGTVPTSSLIHSALGPNVNLMTLPLEGKAFLIKNIQSNAQLQMDKPPENPRTC